MGQRVQDHNLLPYFEAFSLKCHQLQHAIRTGDDRLVRLLDRELDPLIGAIIDHQAQCPVEVHQQLRFINSLIREDADDRSCVLRHSSMLAVLLERYFGAGNTGAAITGSIQTAASDAVKMPGDDAFLNETILNSLPDLVAVVTPDYRHLYCNPAYAEHFHLNQFDMVGRHVSDFFGLQWFDIMARPLFDRCFAGEVVDLPIRTENPADAGLECRLSPLSGGKDRVIGAIMMVRRSFTRPFPPVWWPEHSGSRPS